jgi:serine protease Do
MKQLISNLSAAMIAAILFVPAVQAQDEKKEEKEKTSKDIEHITITKKGDSKEKVTVVIDGDKITVNGKPIEELKEDGDITVHKSKFKNGDFLMRSKMPGGAMAWNGNADDAWNVFGEDQNRAMLGVVTEKVDNGVEVKEITKESAASKAGLKEGDIITKLDDKKIEDPDALAKAVKEHKPGDKVSVTYLRDKKENKATAELTKYKGVTAYSFTPGQQNWDFKMPDMDLKGLAVPRVSPKTRAYGGDLFNYYGGQPKLGLSVQDTDDGKGVKVIEVDEESNAAKAGVKENDIITHVNDKEVNSADEVAKLVKENKDKPGLSLKLKRDGKTQTIEVKMPRKLKTADL